MFFSLKQWCFINLNNILYTYYFWLWNLFPIETFFQVETYDKENYEICSLSGTVSNAGSHLHIVLGRADGSVLAGHVVGNAEVQTTAEVVLGDSVAEIYNRVYDPSTHYNELQVSKRGCTGA